MSETITPPAGAGTEPGPDALFRRGLAEGRLRLQRCRECGARPGYPRLLCVACGSPRLEWHDASGLAVVHSTTVIRRPAERGGDYNLCLVDLDEGVRLMSRVDGVTPDRVRIGMRVRARIVPGDEGPLVVFVPAPAGEGPA